MARGRGSAGSEKRSAFDHAFSVLSRLLLLQTVYHTSSAYFNSLSVTLLLATLMGFDIVVKVLTNRMLYP